MVELISMQYETTIANLKARCRELERVAAAAQKLCQLETPSPRDGDLDEAIVELGEALLGAGIPT